MSPGRAATVLQEIEESVRIDVANVIQKHYDSHRIESIRLGSYGEIFITPYDDLAAWAAMEVMADLAALCPGEISVQPHSRHDLTIRIRF